MHVSKMELSVQKCSICVLLVIFIIYLQATAIWTIILHTDDTTGFRSINKGQITELGYVSLNFSVQTCDEVKLALAKRCKTFRPRYVIIIKELPAIFLCYPKQNCTRKARKTSTPYNLPCSQFYAMWISWRNGNITVGKGNVVGENELLYWKHASPINIDYIAIRSSSPTSWIIDDYLIDDIDRFNSGAKCPLENSLMSSTPDITTSAERETSTKLAHLTHTTEMSDNPSLDDAAHSSSTCSCPCTMVGNENPWSFLQNQNLSKEELAVYLEDRLIELKENITTKRNATSAYKYSKMCAPDSRSSSRVMGWLIIVIICIPFVLAIVSDVLTFAKK